MLAAVKSLYKKCECAVRVGGEVGDWYKDMVGLRQGCPLSPLLFAMFNLAKEVRKEGGGVIVGGEKMGMLMFADDIVLIAECRRGLQMSLDVAWRYSRQWRFSFNVGRSKSEVMVFGGRVDGECFWLGEQQMSVVREYCYLGLVLVEEGGWRVRREKQIAKARRSMWRVVGMGMCDEGFSIDAACSMYI